MTVLLVGDRLQLHTFTLFCVGIQNTKQTLMLSIIYICLFTFWHMCETLNASVRILCLMLGCKDVSPTLQHQNRLLIAVQCFVVATLASMTPAVPFIFRNYEYSPDSQPPRASAPPNDEASLYELGGSSKHLVWQAVRASSAAPYYLDDFVCGQDRYLFSIPKCLSQLKTVITGLDI